MSFLTRDILHLSSSWSDRKRHIWCVICDTPPSSCYKMCWRVDWAGAFHIQGVLACYNNPRLHFSAGWGFLITEKSSHCLLPRRRRWLWKPHSYLCFSKLMQPAAHQLSLPIGARVADFGHFTVLP